MVCVALLIHTLILLRTKSPIVAQGAESEDDFDPVETPADAGDVHTVRDEVAIGQPWAGAAW